ncbi:MAG: GNAT family N-acetyltransferase [Eubacteriales bacterium]|nr:GNAT family N-acetyltransferase [Eubacteriales bacterium]
MYIKKAEQKDLRDLAEAAAACFPAGEAESEERIAGRLAVYPDCFWIGRDDFHELVCFAAGPVTKERDLSDGMYADPSVHDPDGDWQMIFSLCTMPQYRRQGNATLLLQRVISAAEEAGRKGIVLTCKSEKVPFYEKFGFVNEGISESKHGGATWYQMRLSFDENYYLERMFQISDDPEENTRSMEETIWNMMC